ncbi:imm11 family protein [Acanthopleuribacter pedis]|uniref:Immunity MXAN-0049 protein domain-containing protein n=1 Tax=Acanthopleuribacter pedis TaxID=442870 RepID=A0A8J7QQ98_9BACT|nr:DUF1629 domain-containing protein [Acanthopleuribacter pedis]MBO1322658.1 hypothetical protein [Acanthopleuribacter pedis]
MDWYEIDVTPSHDLDFAFLREPLPEEVRADRYKVLFGEGRFGDDYPEEPKVYMSKKDPGMKLGDFIGNTGNALVFSKRVKEVMHIDELNMPKMEFLPVWIHNHKRRLASKDYFICNVLETADVLDKEVAKLNEVEGDVASIEGLTFDERKALKAPDLFRLKEEKDRYFASSRLMYYITTMVVPPPTNIYVSQVAVSHKGESET